MKSAGSLARTTPDLTDGHREERAPRERCFRDGTCWRRGCPKWPVPRSSRSVSRFDRDQWIETLPPSFSRDRHRTEIVAVRTAVTKNREGLDQDGAGRYAAPSIGQVRDVARPGPVPYACGRARLVPAWSAAPPDAPVMLSLLEPEHAGSFPRPLQAQATNAMGRPPFLTLLLRRLLGSSLAGATTGAVVAQRRETAREDAATRPDRSLERQAPYSHAARRRSD